METWSESFFKFSPSASKDTRPISHFAECCAFGTRQIDVFAECPLLTLGKQAVLQRGRPRVHVCHGRKPFAECPALTLTLGKTKRKKPFAKCPTLNTRQNQMAQPAVNRYGLFAECHMPDTRHILGLPSV